MQPETYARLALPARYQLEARALLQVHTNEWVDDQALFPHRLAVVSEVHKQMPVNEHRDQLECFAHPLQGGEP